MEAWKKVEKKHYKNWAKIQKLGKNAKKLQKIGHHQKVENAPQVQRSWEVGKIIKKLKKILDLLSMREEVVIMRVWKKSMSSLTRMLKQWREKTAVENSSMRKISNQQSVKNVNVLTYLSRKSLTSEKCCQKLIHAKKVSNH